MTNENKDDLVVGTVASFLIPPVGVILGVMVANRDESIGVLLVAWSVAATIGLVVLAVVVA